MTYVIAETCSAAIPHEADVPALWSAFIADSARSFPLVAGHPPRT